jgi:hypothetical protein
MAASVPEIYGYALTVGPLMKHFVIRAYKGLEVNCHTLITSGLPSSVP